MSIADAHWESMTIFFDKGKGKGHEEVTGIRISTGFVRVRRLDRGGEGRGGVRLGRGHLFRQRARAAMAKRWAAQSQWLAWESPRRRTRPNPNSPRSFRQAALP